MVLGFGCGFRWRLVECCGWVYGCDWLLLGLSAVSWLFSCLVDWCGIGLVREVFGCWYFGYLRLWSDLVAGLGLRSGCVLDTGWVVDLVAYCVGCLVCVVCCCCYCG